MRDTVCAKHPKPHWLLIHGPLLCGLIEFFLSVMLHNLVGFSQDSLCTLPTAQFYSILRLNSNMDLAWPDMNLSISNITLEKLFREGLPQNQESCLKRLMLMQGISPKIFAAGGKRRSGRKDLPLYRRSPRLVETSTNRLQSSAPSETDMS